MTDTRPPKRFLLMAGAVGALSVLCVVAAAFAEPAPSRPDRTEVLPIGGMLPSDQHKGGGAVLRAFRPIVTEAARSTVRLVAPPREGASESSRDLALGVVVDAGGLIVTKASQTEGELICRLPDGRAVKATRVAADIESDLALVRIDVKNLPVARWADRAPTVGQWLATASTAEQPVAVGVVSAPLREIPRENGILGVSVTDEDPGPKVKEILPGSGAAKAGLKPGDVIVEVAGKPIPDGRVLADWVGTHHPGTKLPVRVRRDDQVLAFEATLGRRPGEGGARNQFQNSLGGDLSLRRDGFAKALQHDTVLRPEDCGGPVVGLDGRVVGVNIARAGRTESYALPAELVQQVVQRLKAKE